MDRGACAELGIREQAALLVWPAVYADDWGAAVTVVGDLGVGGVILMRPRLSAAALRERLEQLDAVSELGVLIATDEEGGDVQRLVDIAPLASQAEVSAAMAPDDAYAVVAKHAGMVADVGVDVVLGPVVDVLPAQAEVPLQRSRFFQGDPATVAKFARAYVTGWQAAGMLPVLKHFPGHGSASADTHDAPGITPHLDELVGRDLVPYRQLVDTGAAVMLGHLTVPGLTEGRPASSSSAAIDYLRNELGFAEALVMTDALDMDGAGEAVPAAAVSAIAAGADVVLFTSTSQARDVIGAILSAVESGRIPARRLDEAAERVLEQLAARGHGCATD